jgi:hypothetical protein
MNNLEIILLQVQTEAIIIEVNVKLSLCLIRHHAMKAYSGVEV